MRRSLCFAALLSAVLAVAPPPGPYDEGRAAASDGIFSASAGPGPSLAQLEQAAGVSDASDARPPAPAAGPAVPTPDGAGSEAHPTFDAFAEAVTAYFDRYEKRGFRAKFKLSKDMRGRYIEAEGNIWESAFGEMIRLSYDRPARGGSTHATEGMVGTIDNSRGSGLSAVDGNVFFDQFFVRTKRDFESRHIPSGARTALQPYFRWDPAARRYEVREGVPADLLIGKYADGSGTLTFYRGLRNWNETKAWAGTVLRKRIDPSVKKASGLRKLVLGDPDKDAIFFSLDRRMAQRFGYLFIVSLKMKREDFLRLVDRRLVYVGLEAGFVEVAFQDLDETSRAAFDYSMVPSLMKPYED